MPSYAREEILAWCEGNGVDYVIGLARNSRLVETIGWELADAQAEAKLRGRPARRFKEFLYATLTSWSRKRRVVAKAEHLPGKANPRFVVTSLPESFSARIVYERVYCPRGNMENTIKEQQLDLFSDRTSASRFAANQLRILFSAFASILFVALRTVRPWRGRPLLGHERLRAVLVEGAAVEEADALLSSHSVMRTDAVLEAELVEFRPTGRSTTNSS